MMVSHSHTVHLCPISNIHTVTVKSHTFGTDLRITYLKLIIKGEMVST